MTEQLWVEINRIFEVAVALPAERRSGYLESACAGNTELLKAVEDLLQADFEAASYLETPAAVLLGLDVADGQPARLLADGQLLNDRFRVLRILGVGGMGQVYEAFDEDLGVHIAIKVIRPELASRPNVVRRFRHEVRLARSITHPNVCRTFDLERVVLTSEGDSEPRELLCLTMEYLPGQTLAEHLAKHGALSLNETLAIATQIAAALDAAHACGVVHRDIKPQNVLLVAADGTAGDAAIARVVVTDFGLARMEKGLAGAGFVNSTSLSHTGPAAGTFAYMAPEQLEGKLTSAATDIYAFGLVLFEMLTGQRASSSGALLASFAHSGALEQAKPVNSGAVLTPAWKTTIARCLAVHPQDRFATAGEVIGSLAAPVSKPRESQRVWPLIWGLAIALLVVASLVLGLPHFHKTDGESATAAGSLVYVPPVKNLTPISNLQSVTGLMRAALTQSSHLNLVDDERVANVLERMARKPDSPIDEATAREIAMRSGAARVVFLTLRQEGGFVYLDVDIQQTDNTPESARKHWPRSWSCCNNYSIGADNIPADLLYIIRDASDWIRKINGEAPADIVSLNAPVDEVTTTSWEALADFENAERLAAQSRRTDALVALKNAVARDPGFALAFARMGDILFSLDRGTEGLSAYKHALEAGDQRRLTRRERDRLRGLYAIDTWEYAQAENVFQDSTVYYQFDYLSRFYRGSVLYMLDRLPEAADVLRRAELLRPAEASAPLTRGSVLFAMGNASGALEEAATLRSHSHEPEALWLEAEDAYLRNDFGGAMRALRAIDAAGPNDYRSVSFAQRARLDVEAEHIEDAVKVLSQGTAADLSEGNKTDAAEKQMDLAYIECERAQYGECLANEKASRKADTDLRNLRLAADVLGNGLRHAPPQDALHLRTELQELAKHLPSTAGNASDIVKAEADAYLSLSSGRTAPALQQFRRIATLDAPAEAPLRLAHGLMWVAERERDPARRTRLRAEAAQTFRDDTRSRAFIWYSATWLPPGFHAELVAGAH